MWNTLLYQPLLNGLVFFYRLFNNLGLSVIVMSSLLRLLMFPLTFPSLRASQKITELAPELDKLKKKHKNDKQGFAQAQLKLYRDNGANPLAGCLPQLVQVFVLIAFFRAFSLLLNINEQGIGVLNESLYPAFKLPLDAILNTNFLYLDLTKPDVFHLGSLPLPGLFLIGAAAAQFLSSKMMSPTVKKLSEEAEETPDEGDDFAASFQKQSLYLLPLMTLFIGFRFSSGLVVYWFIFSLLTLLQHLILKKWTPKKN